MGLAFVRGLSPSRKLSESTIAMRVLDITISSHFGATAANWADSIMEEIGDKEETAIREFVDQAVILDIVNEVCRACEQRGVKNPDMMESYAKHAVAQFDKRLNVLLAQRQPAATTH